MDALWEKLEFEKGCFINAGKCQVRQASTDDAEEDEDEEEGESFPLGSSQ